MPAIALSENLSLLERIDADLDLKNSIVDALCRAWERAVAESAIHNPLDCPKGSFGSTGYFFSIPRLVEAMRPYGVSVSFEVNQARFEIEESRYGTPIVLLFCKGDREPGGFKTAPKGIKSVEFVESGQLILFPELERETDCPRLWIIADPSEKGTITIYIAYVSDITQGGSHLVVNQGHYVILYSGPVCTKPTLPTDNQPAAVEIAVEIGEIEETVTSNDTNDSRDMANMGR